MKKRFAIINATLVFAVLFSMLLQSVHALEHVGRLFSEKECHHKYTGETEISHQHHPFDECFLCEFTLSAFIVPQTFSYSLHFLQGFIPYQSIPIVIVFSFSGSSYLLRGPPSCIV